MQYFSKRFFSLFLALVLLAPDSFAQPANDNCANATLIPIANGGFGLGNFTSAQTNLTSATIQTGESFAPAIQGAGIDKKSVWYKFSIPTIRAVRITFTQPGTTITAGDAGFAVYKANTCLPTNADISTKLTPIVTFGNTYHPCVPSGDYLIQVSSKLSANGPITVQVEISDQTGAAYDHPNQAYAFGTVNYYAHRVDFNTECQSIEDATEVCSAFANPTDYNKSAWLTFKTPSYFDYMVLQLSGTGASSYFPSNNGQATLRKFGFTLYKGDAVTTPIGSLLKISGCDSLQTNGYYADYRVFKCGDLDTGTVYSIQIFINKDFNDDIRFGILTGGQSATKAPKPLLAGIPSPTNAVGNLPSSPAGTLTTLYDVWGCNSRHNTSNCSPALPDTGIVYGAGKYNLSSFFTFTLTNTAAIFFNSYVTQCGPQPLVRVFKQGVTNNCTGLDTANIIGVFNYNGTIDCLPPGNYTVQVSGQDVTQYYGYFHYGTPTGNYEQCLSNNLGTQFRLDMTAYSRKAANKYSLSATGVFDSINRVGSVMQPLQPDIAYSAISDTMGCQNTLRPIDTTCNPANNKVIYREFVINDSGIVDFSNLTYPGGSAWKYRLYSGDANALATAQNLFSYPDKITGLVPKTECFDYYTSCTNKTACVVAGTYTFTTMGGDADVGRVDKPVFTFVRTRTKHHAPNLAQDMGSIMDTLGVNGGTLKSDIDAWSCDDNAVDINGYTPCTIGGQPATKAIYRQFYLKDAALVQIQNTYYWYCFNMAYGYKTLFYGKVTDGLNGLTPVGGQWNCFNYSAGTTAGCNLLPAGWYTVVSYNQGPSYDNTFRSLNLEGRYNSSINYRDEFNITITPTCPGPKFNRPYKASVMTGNTPHLIQMVNRVNSTPAYPRTDTTYVLPTENFNCILDTPFVNHPIKSCASDANRVVYYVFKTTQECFLQINAGGYYAAVFDKDVRADSLQFSTLKPIQVCNNSAGYIQFCFFQPGTYTLVIFAGDGNICRSVTPSIYIDKIGYSRFDYAKNAYDFGTVPPDSAWHYGKVGDVNPLNAGRAPSNDIFYCTTGSSDTDPTEPVCGTTRLNPNVYNNGPNKALYDSAFPPSNGVARRNLWYTFIVDQPGYVTVKLESKTPQREYQQKFSVYQSNVDATLPFTTVVNTGEVDSTIALGLRHIATNQQTWYYCANLNNSVQFYRDPCTSAPTRYYILVENVNAEPYEAGGTLPNTQTEVSILIDSVNLVLPKHDHYYQAGDLGSVGVGTFQGDVDNYSCATRDVPDPFYYYYYNNCQKTLWYKFTPTITGNVRYRIYINGNRYQDYYQVQLYKQIRPGDSTINGLQIQGYHGAYGSDNTYWAETCVSPGDYYLMITGCDQVNAYVYPEIQLIEAVGDFCSRAVPAVLPGPGSLTASVLVDCHTIGTDYGEFGPQLSCPPGANTADYKSSWFRMDIGGTDTLDVTAYLVENTNAASSDIKYRLMTGDCGAMQEQSCVLDALTQNTYQCLVPGQSYYVQVFTPIVKFNQQVTGTIDLKLSAIAHADTCAPLTNCLATAAFNPLFNCNTDDSVKFVNFSTYGTSITYNWSFGYNNQTSTAVSPYFFYPPLPYDSTYTIKLVVENIACGKKDSVTKTLLIPARPYIDFGPDISRCDGSPITLVATSHPGATYLWQNGSTDDTLRVTAIGNNEYRVKVTYGSCSSTDTVKIVISPIVEKPIQNVVLCATSVSLSAYRGYGETYRWSTGATGSSITVMDPGIYWADVTYYSCTYRDSFIVNNINDARPLGSDTTACLSNGGYILDATTSGAVSYTWQDGSTADTFAVTAPGQYNVTINFGSCTVKDTVNVTGFPTPVSLDTDTTICFGSPLTLPWGAVVNNAGVYRDTLRFGGGCDSLYRSVTVTVNPKPNLGKDTTVCFARNAYTINGTTAGAISYLWQDGTTTTATFNATTPGLYWINVNFGNCSTRDSINLSDFPAPVVNTTSSSICAGSTAILPWGGVVGIAGTYRDTIPSTSGCDSVIQVFNLTVNPKPALGRDSSINICGGTSFNLTGVYSTTGLTVAWTIGGTPVANPSNVFTSGVYRLIVTNTNNCSDTALLTLSYSPKPLLGNDTAVNICQGNSFNLTAVYTTTGLTGNWTLNNGTVSTPAAVDVSGAYQLVATNSFSCSDTAIVAVTVNPKPVLGNDTVLSVCQGSIVELNSFYITTGLTADWTINNSPVSSPATIITGGVYRLIVTSASGCKDTAFATLTFNLKPSLGNDTAVSICQDGSFNLTNVYNSTNFINSWTINTVAVANPSAVSVTGPYQLIASTNLGCSDTAVVTLTVNPAPALGNDTSVVICQGNTIDLTSLYNTTGLATNWTLNNGVVNNPSSITVSGVYRLIVTNASNCSDTALATITINPKPILGNDKAASICEGSLFDLTTRFTTANLTTEWTIGSVAVANPSAVSIAGIYQLICTTNLGCSDTALLTLTVNPKPFLGNDTTVSICSDLSFNLENIYTTAGLTANWTIGNNAVANPAAVSIAGNYQLIVTSTDACSDTAMIVLTVNPKPALGNDITISICQGAVLNLNSLYTTTGLTATWTTGNNPVANPAAVDAAGTYQLIAANSFGCSDTAVVTLTVNPKPALGNDTSVNICNGNAIDLTSLYVTNNLNPVWTIGSTTVNNPSSVTISGNYQLIVTNASGCKDTAIVTVTVNPKPVLDNDTTITVCMPNIVDLTALYNIAGLAPVWTIGTTTVGNPSSINVSGTYRLIATNGFGCADTAFANITINAKPLLGNDTSITICSGNNVNLTTLYATTNLNPVWTIGSTTVNNPSAVTASGNYWLIVTNVSGCTDTAIVRITVNPKPVLGRDTSVTVCMPNTVNLTALYNSGLPEVWTLGNAPVGNPAAVSVSGNYQLIVTNGFGCSDTAFANIIINPKPSLGNDTSIVICSGNSVNLTTLYTTTNLNPVWTLNNGAVANPSVIIASGNYRLIVTNASGCSDTAFVNVTVNPKPSLGRDTAINICQGTFFNLTSLYNTASLTPVWTISNNIVANPSAISTSGIYRLIATTAAGCADTAIATITYNAKPALGNDTAVSICQGQTFNLQPVYNTTNLSGSWTFGNIPVSTPGAITVVGVYQLIVVSAQSCRDTALLTLTVNPKPALGRDTTIVICQGRSVDLTAIYNTTNLTTNWTNAGSAVATPTAVSTAGTYRLTATSAAGCMDTAIVTVTVNPKPVLGADKNFVLCQGQRLKLDTLYTTTGNTFNWTLNNGTVASPYIVSNGGIYQLIVINSSGCNDTASVNVAFVANPVLVITDPAAVCTPLTADLTAAAVTAGSTAGLTYTYFTDAAATVVYNTPAAATNGTYYIKGTNANGCSDIKQVTVTSYALPLVTGNNDVAICFEDSTATLTVSVSNISAPVTYLWEPVVQGGIANPTSATTLIYPSVASLQYIVTVTDGYGCNFNIKDTVLVTKQPKVPAFAGNDTTAVVGMPQQLQATGGIGYLWSPASLLNNANISNPLAMLYADSTLLTVIVTDAAGCVGYDTVKIKAYDGITYYVPNAFSPNNDGINDVFRPIPVGIVSTEMFRIYNRYGELVFETNQWMKGWDGMYKGKPQPTANYVWILKGKSRNGRTVEMKGNVVLIR